MNLFDDVSGFDRSGNREAGSSGCARSDGIRQVLWDSQNRMRECVASGVTSTFEYGPDGLRRSMTVTSGQTSATTNYILDGQNVAQEWVDADSDEEMDAGEVVTYMAGPRGVECRIHYDTQQEKDVFRWYIYDGLGSVLSEVDDEGNVTRATTKYDVYGAAVTQEGSTASKHHFVGSIGHTTEPSTGGLIYMRARWYDPVTGRFISEDPAFDGVNWYAYCENSPTNRVDPTGRTSLGEVMSANAVLGSLFGGLMNALGTVSANWERQKSVWDVAADAGVGFVLGAIGGLAGAFGIGGAALGGFTTQFLTSLYSGKSFEQSATRALASLGIAGVGAGVAVFAHSLRLELVTSMITTDADLCVDAAAACMGL